MVSATLVSALLFLAGVVKADQSGRHVAYVVQNITKVSCVSLPKVDECPDLQIKVYSASVETYVKQLKNSLQLIPYVKQLGGDDSCVNAVKELKCLEVQRCIEARGQLNISVDSIATLAACQKARTLCNDAVNNAFLDCDKDQRLYKNISMTIRTQSCKTIQDPTGFCPDVNYKRSAADGMDYPNTFKQIKSTIESVKGNATDDCYKKVKALACSSLRACSDDEKYYVALYNQKDCNKTIDCLPESKRPPLKQQLCSNVGNPDDPNIRTVPYPGVSSNNTGPTSTGPTPTSENKGTDKPTGEATSLKNTAFVFTVAIILPFI